MLRGDDRGSVFSQSCTVASRIQTTFEASITERARKAIEQAARLGRLPAKVGDANFDRLKADLAWSRRQMTEWVRSEISAISIHTLIAILD